MNISMYINILNTLLISLLLVIGAPHAATLDISYHDDNFVVAPTQPRAPLTDRLPPVDPFAAILARAKETNSSSEPVQIAKGIYFGPTVVASAGNLNPVTPQTTPYISISPSTKPASVTAAPCEPGYGLPARDRYTVCFILDRSDLSEKDHAALKDLAHSGSGFKIEAYAFGNEPGHDQIASARGQAIKDTLIAAGANEKDITSVSQSNDQCVTHCPQYGVITFQPSK